MPSGIYYQPELLYAQGQARMQAGLFVGDDGTVLAVTDSPPPQARLVRLAGKALLPGLANAHSHTFQRLFRGRAEGRVSGGDTFWNWREQMYRAAAFVSPDDLYDVARATFLEMAAAGVTLAGEFHYLHCDADGHSYDDPNLLSRKVIAAAQSIGLRICLLRSAYFRAGYRREPHPGQRRFYETLDSYLANLVSLRDAYQNVPGVAVGAAPHSIRAVPLEAMASIAAVMPSQPLHLHISEQPGENTACLAEYGATPVTLLVERGLLTARTTLIHAIHLTADEFAAVARAGSSICSCPTTERNLGDGIFPADTAARLGIPVTLGTDSQAQIDLLEDARQLEYHLRLRDLERGILDSSAREGWATRERIGPALFRTASSNGYAALGVAGGRLAPGEPADFFTIDMDDLSILGLDADSLADQAVFALNRSAIRDVAVQGRLVLTDGHHPLEEEIRLRYKNVQQRYCAQ
jgi:formimidoylglutamate deiminase